jgi:tetratricopeptide (TPR) repeat protein
MAADPHLESLLGRIQSLSGRFGRASIDIEAICTRARTSDYRGVLQNARVVVETLLRSIIAREKNESPGKDTLEKLIPKLFQEGKPSTLPMHIVMHVRTIQAWGNAGAHDQHADLFEEGLEVKAEEATAALNSLVAILEWYRDKYLLDGSTPSAPIPPARTGPQPLPPVRRSNRLAFAIVAAGVTAVAGGAFLMIGGGAPEVPATGGSAEARATLNRTYLTAHEVPPPKACEENDPKALELFTNVTGLLEGGKPHGKRAEDLKAVQLLSAERQRLSGAAEYWQLEARALHYAGEPDAAVREAADKAIALCKTFAPPYNVHGNLGLLAGEAGFAELSYVKAADLAPDYLAPVFNLGLIDLDAGKLDEAIARFTKVLGQDPEYTVAYRTRAQAYLAKGSLEQAAGDLAELTKRQPKDPQAFAMLGSVKAKLGKDDEARAAYCKAKELGHAAAAELCP